MKKLFFTSLLFIFLIPKMTFAGKGEINFIETDVDLSSNGAAVIAYTIQWKVISGDFHGFYFQKDRKLTANKVSDNCYAIDSEKNKYSLDILQVSGGKWDIVLANGKGISRGDITYVFYFTTDFSKGGYVAKTTSPQGKKLVVFNWSPSQFDEARNQSHYTLKVLTHIKIPANIICYLEC